MIGYRRRTFDEGVEAAIAVISDLGKRHGGVVQSKTIVAELRAIFFREFPQPSHDRPRS